jgi:hypothetical protein
MFSNYKKLTWEHILIIIALFAVLFFFFVLRITLKINEYPVNSVLAAFIFIIVIFLIDEFTKIL